METNYPTFSDINMNFHVLMRRKWMYTLFIGILLLFMILILRLQAGQSKQVLRPLGVNVFLDPQRNLPLKARNYDWDIKCEPEDYADTKFIKTFFANFNGTIPEISFLESLSREELATIYHLTIENPQYLCRNILRLGWLIDGGWDVCHEAAFIPKAPCVVYSFGINNDFSFDDAVIDQYGCMVHSFDPSMDLASHKRKELNYFHKTGLSSEDSITKEGWEISRLSTIREKLGHSKINISILKMDIELWEWAVLPDIIDSGVLDHVDSLLIEFHLNLMYPQTESGRSIYLRGLKILKRLYGLGFRIFYTHRNPSLAFHSKCRNIERVNCHEVSFVKVKKA